MNSGIDSLCNVAGRLDLPQTYATLRSLAAAVLMHPLSRSMPISVVCPGCQARFSVSEKFAGKKGPCPKCKAPITIPELPKEEVKIHVPEAFATGGKDSKGRAVLKPIARTETKVTTKAIVVVVGSVVAVLAVAFVLGRLLGPNNKLWLPVILFGLLALGPPISVAGYSFLREQELEAYSGRNLWLRAGICALVYAALWGVYAALRYNGIDATEMWQWLFVGPIFVGIGGAVAWAALDLEFSSAALHYSFYLILTLLLRAAIGMPPVWTALKA